jgi:hypothetical protein
MRWIVISAVAIALSGLSTASATAQERSVNTTLTADVTRIWDGNSCCAIARDLDGTARFARFGRFEFTGEYDLVTHFFPVNAGTTALSLTFVAANGDSFTVGGVSDFYNFGDPPPAGTWTIVTATGRFARYEGSGTYEVNGLDPANGFDPTTPLTISLVGTVTK